MKLKDLAPLLSAAFYELYDNTHLRYIRMDDRRSKDEFSLYSGWIVERVYTTTSTEVLGIEIREA